MNWLQKLHATYEACIQKREFRDPPQSDNEKEIPALLPVSHISQQAHIHVILDGQGNFSGAELLPPKTQIVIPATEDSASRTSGVAPHPLADKIHYCAKEYAGDKKNCFDDYQKQLATWCSSPYSHSKALVVHSYISRGTLVRDLLGVGILHADATGKLASQAPADKPDSIFKRLNGNKKDQGDALIVWSVQTPGDNEPRIWKDRGLQQAWIDYDASQTQQKPLLCMVEGKMVSIMGKHPRNIRRPGDGAKLISSNDKEGFTFRGRFDEPEDACTVGYELSLKAHNALRWLIARQGYRKGEQAVVAWTEQGLAVPNPVCWPSADDFDFAEIDWSAEETTPYMVAESASVHRDVGQSFSRSLAKTLCGYRQDIKDATGIAVLALDSASPGRLSMTFYRERMPQDYLDKLEQWQKDMAWTLPLKLADAQDVKARTVLTEYAPLPESIAQTAFGRRIDDRLLKATVERLLPCIVDAVPIPQDLVENCVRRACNRAGMEKREWLTVLGSVHKGEAPLGHRLENREWLTVLGVACALYKGFYARHPQPEKRRTYSMALDRNRSTRDYLYGRLLAVFEYAERCALDRAGEKRPTNAERLMQRFADNPAATRLSLEKHMSPYMQRLQSYEPSPYKKIKRELQEISDTCANIADFTSAKRLDGEFLIGYHCQLADFYKKKETASPAQEEERA